MEHPSSAATISSVTMRNDPATGALSSVLPGPRLCKSGGFSVSASAKSATLRTVTRTALGASASCVKSSSSKITPTSRASALAIAPSAGASSSAVPLPTATTASRNALAASSHPEEHSSSVETLSSSEAAADGDDEVSCVSEPSLSPYPSRSNTSGSVGETTSAVVASVSVVSLCALSSSLTTVRVDIPPNTSVSSSEKSSAADLSSPPPISDCIVSVAQFAMDATALSSFTPLTE
mmetsp:Transcript_7505/g.28211  ORF Transcript_7505/g.28211 Transcript_7505/m.28211 type:complete len:236 (-) Transcript_7505:78-785(-)